MSLQPYEPSCVTQIQLEHSLGINILAPIATLAQSKTCSWPKHLHCMQQARSSDGLDIGRIVRSCL